MTAWVVVALLSAAAASAAPEGAISPREAFAKQVVTLSVTRQGWDQDRPWARLAPEYRVSVAVVVEGPYLLTSAQMVAGATLIEVRKLGRAMRAEARVVRADTDVDLALLAVDEPGFFADLQPVALAHHVPTDGTVESVRWRERQIEVSVSRVSRVEVRSSLAHSVDLAYLLVTTDLRGGGWSEPVFASGRLVGLTVSQSEQTADVLPVDAIATFLAMARAEPYAGFASLELNWMTNEDPALASYLGLGGEPRGVVVMGIPCGSSAAGVLRPRDILLALDGHAIDASGYFRHPRYGQLLFSAIASGHRAGERLEAQVWRDGALQPLRIELRRASAEMALVPRLRTSSRPSYYIAGGLVFRELDGDYLRSWGRDWWKQAPLALLLWADLFGDDQSPDRRRVIVLTEVLPHTYSVGYHEVSHAVVRAINGRTTGSLADVVAAFRNPQGAFHHVNLYPNGDTTEVILDAATCDAATREILAEYRIPAAMWMDEAASTACQVEAASTAPAPGAPVERPGMK